ncbi:MFS transporter [Micromonospora sp. CPCC 206061]|uniref:MFS transporter n=1 Tax=Micromonospora sp. CPCC 206061 TaxID=3122410 RepID=UPI002FEF2153
MVEAPPSAVPGTSRPYAAVGALLAFSVAAFCYVAMETLPIGLLELIAEDMHVSISDGGLLVTGYALTVVLVSVPLAHVTRGIPRRLLMGTLLAVLVIATVVSATAHDYAVLLTARVVVALTQALFWAVVAPAAAAMFPPHIRGRVTSVVFAGASLGPMLGVPAGTWLGQQLGWRAAFYALAGLAFVAFVAVVVVMPKAPVAESHAATGSSPSRGRYWMVIATTALSVAGLFTVFTYTTVFLTDVTGIAPAAIGLMLLIRGVADFAGIAAGGVVSDRNQRLAVTGPVVLLAASLFGMFAFARTPVPTVAMLAVSGFAMGALTTGLQNRVMTVAPGSTDMASAGNSAAYNVGIAAGSLLGAGILPAFGTRGTALAGGLIAALALAVTAAEPLVAGRLLDRKSWTRAEAPRPE